MNPSRFFGPRPDPTQLYASLSVCEAQASAWAARPWSSSLRKDDHADRREYEDGIDDEAPPPAAEGQSALLGALGADRDYRRALLRMLRRLDLAACKCNAHLRVAWADARDVAAREQDGRDRERVRRAYSAISARDAARGVTDSPDAARAMGGTPQQFRHCAEEILNQAVAFGRVGDTRADCGCGSHFAATAGATHENTGCIAFPVRFCANALGLNLAVHRKDGTGARVIGTLPGSTAARAGVVSGDTVMWIIAGREKSDGAVCVGARLPLFPAENAPFAAIVGRLQHARRPMTAVFCRRPVHLATLVKTAAGATFSLRRAVRAREGCGRRAMASGPHLPTDTTARVCARCGAYGAAYWCSRCCLVSYCGWKCQRADWKANHRLWCRRQGANRSGGRAGVPLVAANNGNVAGAAIQASPGQECPANCLRAARPVHGMAYVDCGPCLIIRRLKPRFVFAWSRVFFFFLQAHDGNAEHSIVPMNMWTVVESQQLMALASTYGGRCWNVVSRAIGGGHTPFQCLQHWLRLGGTVIYNISRKYPFYYYYMRRYIVCGRFFVKCTYSPVDAFSGRVARSRGTHWTPQMGTEAVSSKPNPQLRSTFWGDIASSNAKSSGDNRHRAHKEGPRLLAAKCRVVPCRRDGNNTKMEARLHEMVRQLCPDPNSVIRVTNIRSPLLIFGALCALTDASISRS